MKEKYFVCETCKKDFKDFYLLTRHKERKYPCKPNYFRLLEESRENYELLTTHDTPNTPNDTPNTQNDTPNTPNDTPQQVKNILEPNLNINSNNGSYNSKHVLEENANNISNSKNENNDSNDNICKHCNNKFKNKRGLLRHYNELRCNKMLFEDMKNIVNKTNNKIAKKKYENLLKNNSNVNINNTTNNNTTNNNNNSVNTNTNISGNMINSNNVINNNNNNNNMIQVNPFGKEDIDFITDVEKLGIINSCCMAVPNMIKKTHSNDKNHNFYLRNINRKEIKFLNDKYQMEICDYDEFCNRLIDNNIDRVSDIYDEHKDKMSPRTREKMKKIINENYRGLHYDYYIKILRFPIINMTNDMKNDILKLEKMIKEGKVFPPLIEEKNNIKPICSKS